MPIHLTKAASGVATLTLCSPERLNAYDRADLLALDAALAECEDDRAVRCLVLAGAGRAFCAGADLDFVEEIRSLPVEKQPAALDLSPDVVLRLTGLRCPTIAAVQGAAFGGGACLALACDDVVMSDDASLGLMFTDLGLPGGDSAATWLLSRRVGTRLAWTLLAHGARIDAARAHELGVTETPCPASRLASVVQAKAEAYASRSTAALETTKRQLLRWESYDRALGAILSTEKEEMLEAFRGPDVAEGVAAFREKRPPRWNALA
jgi:2-(1,2-epoxy-1,2-dihydrophenyl)acetyl-CoA isomerase